jgi:hypothetical protein
VYVAALVVSGEVPLRDLVLLATAVRRRLGISAAAAWGR